MAPMDQKYKEALQIDNLAFLFQIINSFFHPNEPAILPAALRSGRSQKVAPPPPYNSHPRFWNVFHQPEKYLMKKDRDP
ncbi:unnamed protein product [Penicillium salamii]|nr:unnamed protein product [Penicillium salamii]